MSLPNRILPLFVLFFALPSCDSLKSKALAFLDKKIEETGGDPGAQAGESSGEDLDHDQASAPSAAPAGNQERIRAIHGADEYEQFTKLAGHVIVVDFYADWCGPCRRLAPILDSIVEAHGGRVLLGKVDVDKNQDIAVSEGVQGIPDVRIFVNGKQADRFVGLPPENVAREKIEAQLAKLSSAPPTPKPEPAKPKPEPAKPQPPGPKTPAAPAKPEETKPPEEEPKIKPMDKDWLPPGVQRKGA